MMIQLILIFFRTWHDIEWNRLTKLSHVFKPLVRGPTFSRGSALGGWRPTRKWPRPFQPLPRGGSPHILLRSRSRPDSWAVWSVWWTDETFGNSATGFETWLDSSFDNRGKVLLLQPLQSNQVGFAQANSSILMLFYYLATRQNDSVMTSRCMQITFGDKREIYLLGESALPVTEKENMREGKRAL